ncbi:hypothetical protein A7J05_22105 [Streptomyces alfalfae]|uniref:Uncharacterized protein n=1 Tax=Streptomyces alfalfae TaxID=1642299 RepID=A0ABM6GVR2_9ACTN|nr:hypothetical protein A7J05_22105 [Streptomyces alfalfae]
MAAGEGDVAEDADGAGASAGRPGVSTLLAGLPSSGACIGTQGALELPERSVATMATAYTAQSRPTNMPMRRYLRPRRPVASTKTGPSAAPPTGSGTRSARWRPTPSI